MATKVRDKKDGTLAITFSHVGIEKSAGQVAVFLPVSEAYALIRHLQEALTDIWNAPAR